MPEEIVLVTGISGFIASHVAKVLLENGYRVKGTVRSLKNTATVDALKNLNPEASHSLELVEADLTADDGWDQAMEGCSVVMHIASPFPEVGEVTMKEEDVVVPAREGTLRVMKAVVEAKIKKVVLTSSMASVVNCEDDSKPFTEEDWANPDSPAIDSYAKSKVLAEKAVWDFQKELSDDEKFELVVINPAFVLGPALLESHKNATSVKFLWKIMNKVYPAVPRLSFNICDVRDVAMAHLKGLTIPEAVGHRHLITTDKEAMWFKDINAIVAKEFKPQGYSITTAQAPNFAIWIGSIFNRPLKSYVYPRLGLHYKLDNKRMIEVLGIEPIPIETTINEMAYSLVDLGIVKKAKKYKQVGSRAEVTPTKEEVKDAAPEPQELEPEEKDEKKKIEEEKVESEEKTKEVEEIVKN